MHTKTIQKILSILALVLAGATVLASIGEYLTTGLAIFRSIEWSILFLSIAVIIGLFSKKK